MTWTPNGEALVGCPLAGRPGGAATGAGAVEFAYPLSTATSIYGGTSEILKSTLAELSLGLPRSPS